MLSIEIYLRDEPGAVCGCEESYQHNKPAEVVAAGLISCMQASTLRSMKEQDGEQGQEPILLRVSVLDTESRQESSRLDTKSLSQHAMRNVLLHVSVDQKDAARVSGDGILTTPCTALELTSTAQQRILTMLYFDSTYDITKARC